MPQQNNDNHITEDNGQRESGSTNKAGNGRCCRNGGRGLGRGAGQGRQDGSGGGLGRGGGGKGGRRRLG